MDFQITVTLALPSLSLQIDRQWREYTSKPPNQKKKKNEEEEEEDKASQTLLDKLLMPINLSLNLCGILLPTMLIILLAILSSGSNTATVIAEPFSIKEATISDIQLAFEQNSRLGNWLSFIWEK